MTFTISLSTVVALYVGGAVAYGVSALAFEEAPEGGEWIAFVATLPVWPFVVLFLLVDRDQHARRTR